MRSTSTISMSAPRRVSRAEYEGGRGLPRLVETPHLRSGIRPHELVQRPPIRGGLQSEKFYKQDFDEAFQVSSKAVIFGFKNTRDSQHKPATFVRIRFPASLAAALRFERIH